MYAGIASGITLASPREQVSLLSSPAVPRFDTEVRIGVEVRSDQMRRPGSSGLAAS